MLTYEQADQKITELTSHAPANVNLCAACYQLIRSSEAKSRGALLKRFIYLYHFQPCDMKQPLPQEVSDTLSSRLRNRYGSAIREALRSIEKRNLSASQFYSQLWRFIADNKDILPANDRPARIVALHQVTRELKIPYCQVDEKQMLDMSDDHFRELNQALGQDILDKVDFILSREFDQLTHQSSLLLQLLLDQEDYEKTVVLLGRAIRYFQREKDQLEDELRFSHHMLQHSLGLDNDADDEDEDEDD